MPDQMTAVTTALPVTKCYHCRQDCEDDTLWFDGKPFCCYGCQTVYDILQQHDLCTYYDLESSAHPSLRKTTQSIYQYLDEPDIRRKMLTFESDDFARIVFSIPSIHCASCIWLLENLHKLEEGVLRTEVNFGRKTATIDFKPRSVTPGTLAGLLSSLGYAPSISLDNEEPRAKTVDRSLLYKLAVAGFCFGNVMLFSFPEYLGIDHSDRYLMRVFSWLNVALSIPVLFYSGNGYLMSAAKSFRQRQINIDVPIAVGLLALFFRSLYDIVTSSGAGYIDSLAGLVFFLLIGRWFQNKTYESLAFDRDFKSYFPLAVQRFSHGQWSSAVVTALAVGDRMRIRNMEIVPADARLEDEEVFLDYSFVTGESRPVLVRRGDFVYAGGRVIGQPAIMIVEKRTSQSRLTSLWQHNDFRKEQTGSGQQTTDRFALGFTWVVLAIAAVTAAYWQLTTPSQMWLVLTSVLMVACPCALALAAPFTYGNLLRVFGRYQFYLKDTTVIERLAAIDAVVFDKTGTLTYGHDPVVQFHGSMSAEELHAVNVLSSASAHPLSNLIARSLHSNVKGSIGNFRELPGKGIEGRIGKLMVRIGAPGFTGCQVPADVGVSYVCVAINNEARGYFSVQLSVRPHSKGMLDRLGDRCVALISGDGTGDHEAMRSLFPPITSVLFRQTPQDKLNFIRNLQQQGRVVLMVGDGLNDAGALKQSNVGIAVTDDTGIFTPACDGILHGDMLSALDLFIDLAKRSTIILKAAFVISFLYNAVAIGIAASGHLSPLIAAILMPLSSISVVAFTTLAVRFSSHQKLSSWVSSSSSYQ
jgi:Cu+-exporting ATPase